MVDSWSILSEIALGCLSLELADDKSTLVQVMAGCHQATSHYISQCWPWTMWPYGSIRPQWVKALVCHTIVLFFWQVLNGIPCVLFEWKLSTIITHWGWVSTVNYTISENQCLDWNFTQICTFFNENIWILWINFTEVCSEGSNWQ